MYCSKCGDQIDPSSTFCPNCGSQIATVQAGVQQEYVQASTARPAAKAKPRGFILLLIAGIMLVLLNLTVLFSELIGINELLGFELINPYFLYDFGGDGLVLLAAICLISLLLIIIGIFAIILSRNIRNAWALYVMHAICLILTIAFVIFAGITIAYHIWDHNPTWTNIGMFLPILNIAFLILTVIGTKQNVKSAKETKA